MARSLVLFLAFVALALPGGALAQDRLYNILPPGQAGVLPPVANSTDQAKLYDDLAPLFGSVTDADITTHFKNAAFGVQGATVRTERPRKGLTIKRDSFGVPHIQGKTRADVMFGSG